MEVGLKCLRLLIWSLLFVKRQRAKQEAAQQEVLTSFFFFYLLLFPVWVGALRGFGDGEGGAEAADWPPPAGEPRPGAAEGVTRPGSNNVQVHRAEGCSGLLKVKKQWPHRVNGFLNKKFESNIFWQDANYCASLSSNKTKWLKTGQTNHLPTIFVYQRRSQPSWSLTMSTTLPYVLLVDSVLCIPELDSFHLKHLHGKLVWTEQLNIVQDFCVLFHTLQ